MIAHGIVGFMPLCCNTGLIRASDSDASMQAWEVCRIVDEEWSYGGMKYAQSSISAGFAIWAVPPTQNRIRKSALLPFRPEVLLWGSGARNL